MSAISKLLDPLRHAVAAFFKHDLALRRDDSGLQIVLEPKVENGVKKKPKKGSREDAVQRKDQQELALVLEQLHTLLSELPETRQTMRPLVFVEQALNKKGLRALHKLPLDVLQRALEQLEALVTNWSPVGLANLRSKMAVAILDREHMDPEAEADAYRTAAVIDAVSEEPAMPEVLTVSDDEALAAAYAAMGALPSSGGIEGEIAGEIAGVIAYEIAGGIAGEIEFQAELGSSSAKAMAAPLPRAGADTGDIQLLEVRG